MPIGAGLLIGLSASMFDPIRIWSIQAAITHYAEIAGPLSHIEWVAKVRQWVLDELRKLRERLGGRIIWWRHDDLDANPWSQASLWWADRLEIKQRLDNWLTERPATFLLLTGPQGCGKSQLMESVVEPKK